jgi:hypothetical protein
VEHDVEEDPRLRETRQEPLREDQVALEETGRNSVRPCKMPSRMACQNVTDIDEV